MSGSRSTAIGLAQASADLRRYCARQEIERDEFLKLSELLEGLTLYRDLKGCYTGHPDEPEFEAKVDAIMAAWRGLDITPVLMAVADLKLKLYALKQKDQAIEDGDPEVEDAS